MNRLISITVFASLMAVAQSVDAKPKVGILGLEPVDDSGEINKKLNAVAQLMTTLIRETASQERPPQYKVVESASQEFLEVKILFDCTIPKVSCLVPIGKELKVDFLVYGQVVLIPGEGYEVSLERLNVGGKRDEGQAEQVVPFSAISNPKVARRWARLLWNKVNGQVKTGMVTVTSNALEGTIFIQGKRVGTLTEGRAQVPLVPPGTHTIRIESEDGSATGSVDVVKGDITEIELNVVRHVGPGGGDDDSPGGGDAPINDRRDSRLGWKIAFGTGVLATAGLAGSGYYYGIKITGERENDVNSMNRSCDDPGINMALKDICDEGNRAALLGNISWVSATAVGLASLYFGYKAFLASDSPPSSNGVATYKKRKQPVVRILPVGPGDIGGSLEVTF